MTTFMAFDDGQQHDDRGNPVCPACAKPVLPAELYVVVHKREPVDSDSTQTVHLTHFVGNSTLAPLLGWH